MKKQMLLMILIVGSLLLVGCDETSSSDTNGTPVDSDIEIVSDPVVIPAPGAIILGSIGVGLVGWLRRKHGILTQ